MKPIRIIFYTCLTYLIQLTDGHAETLESALAKAYSANPQLNAARAALRAMDETVDQAQAGYRPTVSAEQNISVLRRSEVKRGKATDRTMFPREANITISQTLFDGSQTENNTRRAESNVVSQRETLRFTEMTTLFSAAQSYMNVLSGTATLHLRRNNVEVLEEQLLQSSSKFTVGTVTATDVAQAKSRLAGARSDVSAAEAELRAFIGIYRRAIGVEPRQLAPGRPPDRYIPGSLEASIVIGSREHPQILSSLHAVDAAEAQVRVSEGQLYPQIDIFGSVKQREGQLSSARQPNDQQLTNSDGVTVTALGRLTVPIYNGGRTYSEIRQAKELAGQTRIRVEQVRDEIRATIVSAWGQLEAAKSRIIASEAQVQANELALTGVREEASVGQRTTLDILNAQQELLNSRINLIIAQRDRVLNSYGVIQAIGRLTARFTVLPVATYNARTHYDQIKNLWFGVRTPDGR